MALLYSRKRGEGNTVPAVTNLSNSARDTKRKRVSYTPGLELCRDRFKGGARNVERRNGACILRRPEEVENERSTVKQWAPPDDTRYEHSPETSPLFRVETPNTVISISRHRVREHPQQSPCSLLGERDNKASLIMSYHGGSNQYHKTSIHVIFHTHNSNTKSESHILSRNHFSALKFKNKIKLFFNLKFKIKFH